MKYLNIIIPLLFAIPALQGEIVDIRVDWNNIQCQADCATQVERQFKRIKEASSVSVDAKGGTATLTWKADTRFSYQPIRAAFARVGIAMQSLRLTVRGTISSSGRNFYIHSLGDKSKFRLLGTIQPQENRFEPTNSPFNRPLTKQQIEQLKLAESQKLVATVSGPILNLEQLPPYDLITERLNISDKPQ